MRGNQHDKILRHITRLQYLTDVGIDSQTNRMKQKSRNRPKTYTNCVYNKSDIIVGKIDYSINAVETSEEKIKSIPHLI